jgi:hypothetical protein
VAWPFQCLRQSVHVVREKQLTAAHFPVKRKLGDEVLKKPAADPEVGRGLIKGFWLLGHSSNSWLPNLSSVWKRVIVCNGLSFAGGTSASLLRLAVHARPETANDLGVLGGTGTRGFRLKPRLYVPGQADNHFRAVN